MGNAAVALFAVALFRVLFRDSFYRVSDGVAQDGVAKGGAAGSATEEDTPKRCNAGKEEPFIVRLYHAPLWVTNGEVVGQGYVNVVYHARRIA